MNKTIKDLKPIDIKVYRTKGNGKGTCGFCKTKILKGELQFSIYISAFWRNFVSHRFHWPYIK